MSITFPIYEENHLLSLALSGLATQGKAVSIDHGVADYMGLFPDLALSAEPLEV